MRQYYFDYKGKRCTQGMIINIKPKANKYGIICNQATFISYIPEKDWYTIMLGPDNHVTLNGNDFFNMLIEITNSVNEPYVLQMQKEIERSSKGPDFKTELCIDGMFFAWLWYIVFMGITTICYGRILGYIFFSVVFSVYRRSKLKEAGYFIKR